MFDNRQTATGAVMGVLKAAEFAADAEVARIGELIVAMVEARQQAKFQFGDGQDALDEVARSLSASVEARRHLARSHARLAQLAAAKGVDWTMWGDVGDTQPDQFLRANSPPATASEPA